MLFILIMPPLIQRYTLCRPHLTPRGSAAVEVSYPPGDSRLSGYVGAWELRKLPTNKNPGYAACSPDSVQFRPILHMIARTRWGVGRPFSPPVLTCLRFVSEICFLFSSHTHYRANNALEGWRLTLVRSSILLVSHQNHNFRRRLFAQPDY